MEDKTADREVNVAEYRNNGETMILTDERVNGGHATMHVAESVIEKGGLFLDIEAGASELEGCIWLTPLQVELLVDFIFDQGLGQ